MEVHTASPDTIADSINSDVQPIAAEDIDKTFLGTIDLLTRPLGTRILALSNEFFAPATNLITPTAPIHRPGVFIESGAWYDGWETRRHNPSEYDYVIFALGVSSGRVKGVEIDTGFFRGNEAPEVSVEGAFVPGGDDVVTAEGFAGWKSILGKQACGPACRQAWRVRESEEKFTHVRLRMYPDGGIGRFRLYGSVDPTFPKDLNQVIDLAATVNGGIVTAWSDAHFGKAPNLLLPGRGVDMGDGWETKRSRGKGHTDWVVVRLGCAGVIDRVVIDTAHFRGNFPQAVRLLAAEGDGEPRAEDESAWTEILPAQPCKADVEHDFHDSVLRSVQSKAYRWVKMIIIPDGGVKRLRVYGRKQS